MSGGVWLDSNQHASPSTFVGTSLGLFEWCALASAASATEAVARREHTA